MINQKKYFFFILPILMFSCEEFIRTQKTPPRISVFLLNDIMNPVESMPADTSQTALLKIEFDNLVPFGEIVKVTISNGSLVSLNTPDSSRNSIMQIPFSTSMSVIMIPPPMADEGAFISVHVANQYQMKPFKFTEP